MFVSDFCGGRSNQAAVRVYNRRQARNSFGAGSTIVWASILAALRDEFSDFGDASQFTRVVVRLLLAVLLGAAIGYERERHRRAAGLRTHMLIALGVALAVVAAEQSAMAIADTSRVLQGILAGIGFLGAGAILKQGEPEHIRGLTTAASVWATAAIAMAAGLGRVTTAIFATIIALIILSLLGRFERRMHLKPSDDERK
jgi:putative Mg2+ transporter-C (MgtC) family protein